MILILLGVGEMLQLPQCRYCRGTLKIVSHIQHGVGEFFSLSVGRLQHHSEYRASVIVGSVMFLSAQKESNMLNVSIATLYFNPRDCF